MSSRRRERTTTNEVVLPEAQRRALNLFTNEAQSLLGNELAIDPSQQTQAAIAGLTAPGGQNQRQAFQDIMSGDLFGVTTGEQLFTDALARDYSVDASPFAQGFAGGDVNDVLGLINRQVADAVGDEFSAAGRTGSPAQQIALADRITETASPFLFNARQQDAERALRSAQTAAQIEAANANRELGLIGAASPFLTQTELGRDARTLGAAQGLDRVDEANIQRLLQAGRIGEAYELAELRAPFERLQALQGGIIGGAGTVAGTETTEEFFENPFLAGIGALSSLAGAAGQAVAASKGFGGLGGASSAAGGAGAPILGGFAPPPGFT